MHGPHETSQSAETAFSNQDAIKLSLADSLPSSQAGKASGGPVWQIRDEDCDPARADVARLAKLHTQAIREGDGILDQMMSRAARQYNRAFFKRLERAIGLNVRKRLRHSRSLRKQMEAAFWDFY
jgi:hypothetical protein